jgi:hypothetical protein
LKSVLLTYATVVCLLTGCSSTRSVPGNATLELRPGEPTPPAATASPTPHQFPLAPTASVEAEGSAPKCTSPVSQRLREIPDPVHGLLQAAIAAFREGQDLSRFASTYDGSTAKVQAASEDLNGDRETDLILAGFLPHADPTIPGGFIGAFIVSSCGDGDFNLLSVFGEESAYECVADWCSYRMAVRDLVGRGAPQVLVAFEEGYTNWSWPWIKVVGWEADQWITYMDAQLDIGPLYSLVIDDSDEDGHSEISVWGFRLGTGAMEISRPIYQMYRWNADSDLFVLAESQPLPSPYRFQILEDAQRAIDSGDTHYAIALYLAAAEGFYIDVPSFGDRSLAWEGSEDALSLDEVAYAYQTAFARFRLTYLYEFVGQPADADRMLLRMNNLYPNGQPGSEFAGMATAMIGEARAGNSLSSACTDSVDSVVADYPDLTGFDGHIGEWGNTNVSYTEDSLCPDL